MTIIRTPAAQRDILQIWGYIARHYLPAADEMIRRIDQKMALLERHPRNGQARDDMLEIRSVTVDRYIILYRPIEGGIEVVRVLHGARNIAAVLSND